CAVLCNCGDGHLLCRKAHKLHMRRLIKKAEKCENRRKFWSYIDSNFTVDGSMKIAAELCCPTSTFKPTYCMCRSKGCKVFRDRFFLSKQINKSRNQDYPVMKDYSEYHLNLIIDLKNQMENYLKGNAIDPKFLKSKQESLVNSTVASGQQQQEQKANSINSAHE
ncbi:hypothetical protein RFI_40195, partial [Reticulomyxa filosa]